MSANEEVGKPTSAANGGSVSAKQSGAMKAEELATALLNLESDYGTEDFPVEVTVGTEVYRVKAVDVLDGKVVISVA